MIPAETEEVDPDPTTLERFRLWRTAPAGTTNGEQLFSRVVWTAFIALGAWVLFSQVQLGNEVAQERIDSAIVREVERCVAANDTRDEAKIVAQGRIDADQAALDSDKATWQAIDELFDAGIPEPARTTIFDGLMARQVEITRQQSLIEETYVHEPCENIVLSDDN